MPSDQLDETITLTCQACGKAFHPRKGYAKNSRVPRTCSPACAQQLRKHSRYGTSAAAPLGKGSIRECPRCYQEFTSKSTTQVYCSRLCQYGAALTHVKYDSKTEADRERSRQTQLRRIADGTHPFINPDGSPKARHASRNWPKSTRSRKPATLPTPTSDLTDAISTTLPPLPDIPTDASEGDSELEGLVANSVTPLTLPLFGQQAQTEWRLAGEYREEQADRRLAASEYNTSEGRTVILAGQGSYVGCENGALVCHMGRTHGEPAPAKEFFYPAAHTLRRILWVGSHGHMTGTMTLSAAAWCRNESVHLTVLDASGFPLLEVLPIAHQDAELRRRQWLISSGIVLPGSPSAGALVRELVRRKVEGQYQTLLKHSDLPGRENTLATFQDWQQWLTMKNPTAPQQDTNYLMMLEARLGMIYFGAWSGWALKWSKPDLHRIPPHWLTARVRFSPLAPNHNGRHAIDPVNACLNYCYSALASQCRQSLYQVGFDVAGGFLHSDKPGRDSLTYDLAELERGSVDDLLLTFLGLTTLHYGDFARKQDGSIVINSQLTRLLLAECRVPQSRVDMWAHWLKGLILPGGGRGDSSAASDPRPEPEPV